MPKIVEELLFDGAPNLIDRLGLEELLAEVRTLICGFELLILEERDSNGAGALRKLIDERFTSAQGWVQRKTGGVDWSKRQAINGRPRFISLGVEIQVSGRSDLIAVDLIHLRQQLLQGDIDLAVLVVPSDRLGTFLTDRVAKKSEAMRHIQWLKCEDMPFVLMVIEHDGIGPALAKMVYKSKT